jgi:hypothetical protein
MAYNAMAKRKKCNQKQYMVKPFLLSSLTSILTVSYRDILDMLLDRNVYCPHPDCY